MYEVEQERDMARASLARVIKERDALRDADASFEALIRALRNDLEKEHRQNGELLGALRMAADQESRAWRCYVRALDCAVAPGFAVQSDPDKGAACICDIADAIAIARKRLEGGK